MMLQCWLKVARVPALAKLTVPNTEIMIVPLPPQVKVSSLVNHLVVG